jgi:hypothetical protein
MLSVPTLGDLIGLKPRHVENVGKRVKIVAFGEPRQVFQEGGDMESSAGGFWRRRSAIVGCHRAFASTPRACASARLVEGASPFYRLKYQLQLNIVEPGPSHFVVCRPQFAMFGGVFSVPAALPSDGNDLTGGLALPMFPAAESGPDRPRTAEKANKSLGYHESGHSGIARQGENDQ